MVNKQQEEKKKGASSLGALVPLFLFLALAII